MIIQRWSIVSRFGLCTTASYGIRSIHVEAECLQNLSSSSVTLRWKRFLLPMIVWCFCSFHIWSHFLSFASWWSIFLSSLSVALVLPNKSSWIERATRSQLLPCVTSVLRLAYCQVPLLLSSWFVWWSSRFLQSLVDWHLQRTLYVQWIQWGWSAQEFFQVFYPPIPLFLNLNGWLGFFVSDWLVWYTILTC